RPNDRYPFAMRDVQLDVAQHFMRPESP
ncbi:MAG: hypothetical protein JWN98_598, partial [Abditibacteriota bacterium]|nr:hypothetical protein [Abditibacteriota bacterium]